MGIGSYLRDRFTKERSRRDAPDTANEATPLDPSLPSDSAALLIPSFRTDEEIEQSTLYKLDRRLLPFMLAVSVISYIDRGNLGFVAADVCTVLNMNHTRYGIGVGCFGIGYALSQVHSNYLLRCWGARNWFTVLLVSWGIVAGGFAFVHSRYTFYVLRLLLGVVEGGTYPGAWYFLTVFYPEQHLTFPFSATLASIAVAGPLAAPLAAGLLSLDGVVGVAGWRLLFFVEGVIPIVYALVIYCTLPSSPQEAEFLDQDEKDWIASQEKSDTKERYLSEEVRTVCKSRDFWSCIVSALFRGVLYVAAFYWTTLIIDDMLHGDDEDDDNDTCAASSATDVAAVALSTVPLGLSAFLTIVFGRVAGRLINRPRVATWITIGSGVFLIGWVIFRNVAFLVALLCLGFSIASFLIGDALCGGVLSTCFDKEARATSMALYNTLAAVGMAVGPIVLGVVVDNHGYVAGVVLLTGVAVLSGAVMATVKDPLLQNKEAQSSTRQSVLLD